jgi:hypothetical protein
MRECDYEKLPDGTIYGIFQRTPEEYEIAAQEASFSAEYKIIVGGPNPQNYRATIWELIANYMPASGTKQVALPQLGDFRTIGGRLFVVSKVTLKVRKEADYNDCRHWRSSVTWQLFTSSFAPQNQQGQPITPATINDAQATVRVRPGTESEPVEYAQFFGFFNGKGEVRNCTWINSDHVCQPLRDMEGQYVPVMNSAGVRFDPGLTKESGVDRVVISKPWSIIPFGIQRKLRNTINCDRFFIVEFRNGVPIFGIDVAPFTARVAEVSHTFETLPNGFEYPVLNVELALKSQRFMFLDQFGDPQYSPEFGWADLIANRGNSMLAYPGRDDYNGGTWPDPPTFKSGGRSTVPISINGNDSAEPHWLTCNGLPLVDPDAIDPDSCAIGFRAEDITYLGYLKYERIKFASANFPGFLGNIFFNTNASGPGSLPAAHFPGWAATQDLSNTVLWSDANFITC